jgi:sulfate transport system permease protein
MEEGAASLGASRFTIFRRIILPNLWPAMLAGTALAFARAISEFGSTVLISGNLPGKTQVAAVQIYGQIESDNVTGAAAVSTVLLIVAFVVLLALGLLQRWGGRRGN